MKAKDCKIGQIVYQKYSGYAIHITGIIPPYIIGKVSDGQFHENDICESLAEAKSYGE